MSYDPKTEIKSAVSQQKKAETQPAKDESAAKTPDNNADNKSNDAVKNNVDQKDKPDMSPEKRRINTIIEQSKKIEELTDLLQRMQADFENYKKICDKTQERNTKFATIRLVKTLLPILDSFELALHHTNNQEEFVKGMDLVYSQFFSALEDAGLKKIDAKGKKFDPYSHEVLMQQECPGEEDIVLEELQTGYSMYDAVLRTSKVKISKAANKCSPQKK